MGFGACGVGLSGLNGKKSCCYEGLIGPNGYWLLNSLELLNFEYFYTNHGVAFPLCKKRQLHSLMLYSFICR